jgi:hypothetical protein
MTGFVCPFAERKTRVADMKTLVDRCPAGRTRHDARAIASTHRAVVVSTPMPASSRIKSHWRTMMERRNANPGGASAPSRRLHQHARAGRRRRRSPVMPRSGSTGHGPCRRRARSTSCICGRNIRASGIGQACLFGEARRLLKPRSAARGVVVWTLDDNENAYRFLPACRAARDVCRRHPRALITGKVLKKVAFTWP